MIWCDIGVNLFSNQFDQDRSEVVERAAQAGIGQLLLIGSDIDESKQNVTFCRQHSGCFSSAGVHPHQAAKVQPDWLLQLSALLNETEVVAIGECGLDFNRDFSPRPQQQAVFAEQLQLASRTNKPVYLHERDAFDTQLAMLHEQPPAKGVAHCFTGDTTQLKVWLDLDLYIGITGWLCDERRGAALRDAVAYIPSDRLLLETDAPYLLPRNLHPKPASRRNEPAFLPAIAAMVAQLQHTDIALLAQQQWQNCQRLFNTRPDNLLQRSLSHG
jgi:TatD DNase family protein